MYQANADDCIACHHVNSENSHSIVVHVFDKISKCCDKWQVSINPEETAVMSLSLKRKPLIVVVLKILQLKEKQHVKYLGPIIQSNLSWNVHVDYVLNKASKKLWYLSGIFPMVTNRHTAVC